ncbi:hypothetical protein M8C13_04540 [Crossiella sp. SN42]|uniref:hypothetical protein n=1 Tax=Crossiella sp. SN42 TaxID=2944808 RepID=UPI00207C450C|nr:hypothetical protein [Crossiella sp. SN42]MCO1575027.1 hypothetical protein [Crossiella sp. SN42]
MARVYATQTQLTDYGAPQGVQLPEGAAAARALRVASTLVDKALKSAVYDTDPVTGLPTGPTVAEAMANATCAQVVAWAASGVDETGAAGQWQNVSIGSVQLGRGTTSGSEPAPGTALCQQGLTELEVAGLLPGTIGRPVWTW